jgi:hypothetical protein
LSAPAAKTARIAQKPRNRAGKRVARGWLGDVDGTGHLRPDHLAPTP